MVDSTVCKHIGYIYLHTQTVWLLPHPNSFPEEKILKTLPLTIISSSALLTLCREHRTQWKKKATLTSEITALVWEKRICNCKCFLWVQALTWEILGCRCLQLNKPVTDLNLDTTPFAQNGAVSCHRSWLCVYYSLKMRAYHFLTHVRGFLKMFFFLPGRQCFKWHIYLAARWGMAYG